MVVVVVNLDVSPLSGAMLGVEHSSVLGVIITKGQESPEVNQC